MVTKDNTWSEIRAAAEEDIAKLVSIDPHELCIEDQIRLARRITFLTFSVVMLTVEKLAEADKPKS